jgi:DNA polymerase
MTVYLDFETCSPVDLDLVGTRTYAEHPASRILCLSYAVADQPVRIWWPNQAVPTDLHQAVTAGHRVAAHNFQFDYTVWHQHMVPLGWPAIPLDRWSCTMFRARLARLPASLEEAAKALDLPVQKDAAGRRFMLPLARRDLDTNPLNDEERCRLAAYCSMDTEVLRALDRRLPEIPEQWQPLVALDFELNARGMPVDLDAVRQLIVVRDAENLRLSREFRRLTEGELSSPKQVAKFRMKLADLGVGLPDLQRETLEAWVDENPRRQDLAAQLIRNRLESSHASDTKLDRMLATACNTGRLRDGFLLHGAHPGRWAGRGWQPQNFPKNKVSDPTETLNALLDRAQGIKAGTLDANADPGWTTSIKEAIAGSLRALLKTPDGWEFVSADFGQIESRALCWVAGQDDVLDEYRRGEDVYIKTAERLGSDSRDLGKLLVLSAGYGASGNVVYTRAPGFGLSLTVDEAHDFTARWRGANSAIVAFWHELFRTLCFVVEQPADQEPVTYRCFSIWRDPEMLFVQLPSGRVLKYRNPRLEMSERGSLVLTVELPKHKRLLPVSLWHGTAAENVTQAIAFDVMVGAMLRLHRDGVFLVGTIHDEIVALAPVEDAEAIRDHMIAVMKTPPVWAPDLPLAADAFINERFVKPVKPAHAPLPPSAAERWMNCPGSVAAVAALPPEPESSFAVEGTEAHRIFAACLTRDLDPAGLTEDRMLILPLRHALMLARDVIAGRRFKVETRLQPLPGLGKVWGTADVLVFDRHDRIVAVIDLKFGAGVAVEPDSVQLQIYALLAAQQYGCPPDGIDLHIVQPRRQHERGPHRMHHIGTDDLDRLFARLQDAVDALEDPAAPRIAGAWCRFCAARRECPAARSETARSASRPLVNPFVGGF